MNLRHKLLLELKLSPWGVLHALLLLRNVIVLVKVGYLQYNVDLVQRPVRTGFIEFF